MREHSVWLKKIRTMVDPMSDSFLFIMIIGRIGVAGSVSQTVASLIGSVFDGLSHI